ncbi:MAG: hypothetical protein AB1566_14235 [Chloroflexota bacterium]
MKRFLVVPLVLLLTLATVLPGLAAGLAATTYSDTIVGYEIFPGVTDPSTGIVYGTTFVGRASGELPGWWRVSVNYQGPAVKEAGKTNAILGGTWKLSNWKGSVYGSVTGGTVTWIDGTHANVTGSLSVVGGTGAYVGWAGVGGFEGLLDETVFPPKLTGTLTLTFP